MLLGINSITHLSQDCTFTAGIASSYVDSYRSANLIIVKIHL